MPNEVEADKRNWDERKYAFCLLLNSTDIDGENIMKDIKKEVSYNCVICDMKSINFVTDCYY